MRIVQLGKFYAPHYGGLEQVTELSAKSLAAENNVTVICFNHKSGEVREILDGINIIRCHPNFVLFRQPISFSMVRILKSIRPDIIHFHAPNFWGAAIINLLYWRTPLVITHHADVEGRKLLRLCLLPLYRRLVRKALAVIVSSRKTAEISIDLPKNGARLKVIPLGVDDSQFIPSREPGALARSVTVGFVGRLVWYKGLAVLLEAFSRLSGDVKLLIVGDGPMKDELVAQSEALGIQHRIQFLGRVSDKEKIAAIQSMDIVAFPSTHLTETFGLAQVEAQLMEKPVVATNLPTGASEIIVDGQTGFIVPCGDPIALANAIQILIDRPHLRKEFGNKGRLRSLEEFTASKYSIRIRSLFHDVEHSIALSKYSETAKLSASVELNEHTTVSVHQV
jgi:rhamnosyl/mannosyltransferase